MWCAPLFQPEERSSLVGQVQQSGEFWRLEKKVEALLAEVKSRVRTAQYAALKAANHFYMREFFLVYRDQPKVQLVVAQN